MRRFNLKNCILGAALSCVAIATQAENVAITGATVHTLGAAGSLENATVLLRDGRIQSVGADIAVPSGYRQIDASGKVVTPGFIGAFTSLGLVEVGLSAGTVDATSANAAVSPTGAALDVSFAINPDSSLIGVSRVEGVTAAASAMGGTGSLFQGQGAIISLAETANPVLKPRAFVVTGVDNGSADDNGGSRAALWVALNQALQEAQFAKGKSLDPSTEWHGLTSKADAKALAAVIDGKVPLLIDARRAADIRQVIALKQRFSQIKPVLLFATEGWRVAEELAAANIPVILDPESNLPFSFDQLGATLSNAGRLQAAGVKVAIGINNHNIRLARQHAANAVANGLSWEQGLASLSANVADIYGLEQHGRLEVGKVADLVIWSGDPLEVMQTAEQVFIGGEAIEMESRQSKLAERYAELYQDKPYRYIRP